jgi:uncharacterized protein (UPF0332 family)
VTEPRKDFIGYRLDRAQETLDDARLLAEAGRWNSCVNRLYYACFYAVSALLLQAGYTSPKHAGVRSLFNRHFVKERVVAADLGRFYNRLFRHRQESDDACHQCWPQVPRLWFLASGPPRGGFTGLTRSGVKR